MEEHLFEAELKKLYERYFGNDLSDIFSPPADLSLSEPLLEKRVSSSNHPLKFYHNPLLSTWIKNFFIGDYPKLIKECLLSSGNLTPHIGSSHPRMKDVNSSLKQMPQDKQMAFAQYLNELRLKDIASKHDLKTNTIESRLFMIKNCLLANKSRKAS
ncbi:hypothetical protein [Coprobacter tertius]|uniref:Uncharacterized protein n=1 Tax=Coprobacter tertius TaxID=2944915 RepID=A0ABT1ME99_9BACT|nr:hypothetical protein [Coprobacter tertius]MCP9610950.1 hypothetical protein [Coprobacter tertius]